MKSGVRPRPDALSDTTKFDAVHIISPSVVSMRATDDQRCIAIFERWRFGLTEGGDSEARRGWASSSPAGETTAIVAVVRFFAS